MPQLDHLIDQWIRSLRKTEPRLEEHLDEISDHVRTDAQARIDAGAETANAFAAAIGNFGAPRDVANEFLKVAMPDHRLIVKYVGLYLLAAILLTVVIVVVDNYYPLDVMWVGIGLMSIMILPVIAIPLYLERLMIERNAYPTTSSSTAQ